MGISIFSYYSKSSIINSPCRLAASEFLIENNPVGLSTDDALVNVIVYVASFLRGYFC